MVTPGRGPAPPPSPTLVNRPSVSWRSPGSRSGLLLGVALLVAFGAALRIPDLEQGITGDELLWLDRGYDLLSQVGLADGLPGYEIHYADLAKRRHADLGREAGPFSITIKAHHPGYLSTISIATVMLALLPPSPDVSELIRVRWVQSGCLIAFVCCLWLFGLAAVA